VRLVGGSDPFGTGVRGRGGIRTYVQGSTP